MRQPDTGGCSVLVGEFVRRFGGIISLSNHVVAGGLGRVDVPVVLMAGG